MPLNNLNQFLTDLQRYNSCKEYRKTECSIFYECYFTQYIGSLQPVYRKIRRVRTPCHNGELLCKLDETRDVRKTLMPPSLGNICEENEWKLQITETFAKKMNGKTANN